MTACFVYVTTSSGDEARRIAAGNADFLSWIEVEAAGA
jgi:hypothetical protein